MSGVKGKSGRKKKTDAEKLILGAKKDRIAGDSCPAVVPDRIIEFNFLGEAGKAIFNHFEPMLYNNGTLSAADGLKFNLLCERYQRWFKVWTECNERGLYLPVKDKEGNTVSVNIAPWARLEKDYFDQLSKCCNDFGLSPVSRSSVEKIVRGEKVNPFKGVTS